MILFLLYRTINQFLKPDWILNRCMYRFWSSTLFKNNKFIAMYSQRYTNKNFLKITVRSQFFNHQLFFTNCIKDHWISRKININIQVHFKIFHGQTKYYIFFSGVVRRRKITSEMGLFLVFFNAQIVKWKARNGRVISDNICKSKNIYKASSTVHRSMMFEWNINNVSKKGVWTSLADAIWQRSIKRYNLRKPHCSPFKKPTFLDIHFLKNSGRHCGPQA